MKKIILGALFLFILFFIYTCIYRINLSNIYKGGFININNMTGDYFKKNIVSLDKGEGLPIDKKHNFIETVIIPVSKNEIFKLNISGGNPFIVFAGYNVLGYKEYKPLAHIKDRFGNYKYLTENVLQIDTKGEMFYSTEVGYNIIRNSLLDKSGKISEIVIQLMTNGSGNIEILKTNNYDL